MKRMRPTEEVLFSAKWKRRVDLQMIQPLLLNVALCVFHGGRGLGSWRASLETLAVMTGFWLAIYFVFLRWQQVVLLQDRLRFTSGRWNTEVKYRNMRAILLRRSVAGSPHNFLSFKLLHPRYSNVNDIPMPRDSCGEILQILAREAPQAELNSFALQLRGEKVSAT